MHPLSHLLPLGNGSSGLHFGPGTRKREGVTSQGVPVGLEVGGYTFPATHLLPEPSVAGSSRYLSPNPPSGSGPSSLPAGPGLLPVDPGGGAAGEDPGGGGGGSGVPGGPEGSGRGAKEGKALMLWPFSPTARALPSRAAMSEGESKESSGGECPVCYEKFREMEGASRTLSCGHMFCHDCLVKYLLSTRVDGQVQRTVVCPVCRYVTFLCKKSSCWPSKLDKSAQTLAVPMGLPPVPPPDTLGHANSLALSQPFWRPSPNQGVQLTLDPPPGLLQEPQIFIISCHGMPLGKQDSILPGRSQAELLEASPVPSSTRSFCSRSQALLLIILIAVVAMVPAILPWVLLVRKHA